VDAGIIVALKKGISQKIRAGRMPSSADRFRNNTRARDGQGGVCLETANFPNNTRAGGPHPKPPNFAINTITWAGPLLGQ
jgi:hypothetical protein